MIGRNGKIYLKSPTFDFLALHGIPSNEFLMVHVIFQENNLNIYLHVEFHNFSIRENIDFHLDHGMNNQQLVYHDHRYLENQHRYLVYHDCESLIRKI